MVMEEELEMDRGWKDAEGERKRWQAPQQSTLMKKNEGLSGPATDHIHTHTHTQKVAHTLSLKYALLSS